MLEILNEKILINNILVIDFASQKMWNNNDPKKETKIDAQPYALLVYLWKNKNNIKSKEQIIDAVWGIDGLDLNDKVVRNNISDLRKYINKVCPDEDNLANQIIVTKRKIGYYFDEENLDIKMLSTDTIDESTPCSQSKIESTQKNAPFNKGKFIFLSKSKQHLLYTLVIIITILIVIISAFFIKKNHTFNSYLDDANTKYDNGQYIEACELYDKASSSALTSSQLTEAYCQAGNCYFSESLNNELDDNTKKQYLDKAVEKYNYILSNIKNDNSFFYYDAVAGLGCCYYKLQYSTDNSNWKNIINIMEKYEEQIDPSKKMNKNEILLAGKLYASLTLYYQKLITSSFENAKDVNIVDKAIEYYSNLILFSSTADKAIYNQYDFNKILCLGADMIDKSIVYYVYSARGSSNLPNLANTIEHDLEKAKTDSNISAHTVFTLNYILGKIYLCMTVTELNDQRNTYINKSYNILSNILYTPYDIAQKKLNNVGYYCVLTGLCTDEDLSQIISNNKLYLSKLNFYEDTNGYVRSALSMLSTSAYISLAYDNHFESDSFALELLEQLLSNRSYINESDLEKINNYYNYFKNNEGDISFERDIHRIMNR